jgi:2-phosphosulfolactate phosphatase
MKPKIETCLSPALLHLYDVSDSIVVIIDVLRATSTISAALYNGAKYIIPVAKVDECIQLGMELNAITAGERDGQIAPGLQYGNSPQDYPRSFIENKILVLTTTNGTKLLHMSLQQNAKEIITGSFANLNSTVKYLKSSGKNILLGCSAWKDKFNLEDTLFAGAVVEQLKDDFIVDCDASKMAQALFDDTKGNIFAYMQKKAANHYKRLMGFDLETDLNFCLEYNKADCLVIYKDGKLVKGSF